MSRDDEIRAIVEIGRRTRKPTPRWMWIAAALVGVICAMGFAVVMLGGREPPGHPPRRLQGQRPDQLADHLADHLVAGRPAAGSGLGIGLVIGVGAGLVIGFSMARHRRDHSSRSSP